MDLSVDQTITAGCRFEQVLVDQPCQILLLVNDCYWSSTIHHQTLIHKRIAIIRENKKRLLPGSLSLLVLKCTVTHSTHWCSTLKITYKVDLWKHTAFLNLYVCIAYQHLPAYCCKYEHICSYIDVYLYLYTLAYVCIDMAADMHAYTKTLKSC